MVESWGPFAALLCCVSTVTACSQLYLPLLRQGRALHAEHGGNSTWNYDEHGRDWPGVCANGTRQSPIAISLDKTTGVLPESHRAQLQLGTARGLHIFNTGHGIQLEWEELAGSNATVPVAGDVWAMAQGNGSVRQVPVTPTQLHFHHTSEHIVRGEIAPLELHIVTKVDPSKGVWVPEECKAHDCLAVFGVLVEYHDDPYETGTGFYKLLADHLPLVEVDGSLDDTDVIPLGDARAINLTDASVNITTLLPPDQSYATYDGSLTTPGCAEGVVWHMFLQPAHALTLPLVEAYQGEVLLGDIQPLTNRAVQPLNGRAVLLSADPNAPAAAQA